MTRVRTAPDAATDAVPQPGIARRMSVLFVAPSAYPLGGVATWLEYLCRELPRFGVSPRVLLVSGHYHDSSAYRARYPQLPSTAVDNPTGSREGRVRALSSAITRERPDVVVSVNIADAMEAVRRMRRRLPAGAPRLAMAFHALEADYLHDARVSGDVLDGAIATNRLMCSLLAGWAGLENERIHYAPYGVEPVPSPGAAARDDASLRVLFAGRLEQEQKRVLDLIGVAHALQRSGLPWQLTIAGDGPERATLQRQLKNFGARIRWLGSIPQRQLAAEVYPAHDALLVLSEWETGPIVAWEAMSAGLPVVTTRYLGSGREAALVHGANCLMFEIGDTAAAASALLRTREAGFRARLAEGGRTLVRDRYARDVSVRAWASALHAIAAAPLRRPGPSDPLRPDGRLDRWFGTRNGERIRRSLGIRFRHTGAGGEWPHSLGASHEDARAIIALARGLDATAALSDP